MFPADDIRSFLWNKEVHGDRAIAKKKHTSLTTVVFATGPQLWWISAEETPHAFPKGIRRRGISLTSTMRNSYEGFEAIVRGLRTAPDQSNMAGDTPSGSRRQHHSSGEHVVHEVPLCDVAAHSGVFPTKWERFSEAMTIKTSLRLVACLLVVRVHIFSVSTAF